ncbi:hypothetical protein Vretimale_11781, partial [Volvox reticuliferus]
LRAALLQGGAVTTAACKDNATAAMAGAQRRFFRRGHSSGLVPHLAGGTAEPHMRGRSPNGGLVMQAWKEVEAEVGRTAVSVQPSPTAASGAVGRLTLSRAGTSERVSEADAVSPDVFNSTAASGGARSGINVLSGTNGKVTPARLATPSMAVPAAPVVASSNGRRFLNKVSNQRNSWAAYDASDSLVPDTRAGDVVNAMVLPLPPIQSQVQASLPRRAATSTTQQRRSVSMDGWQRRAAVSNIQDDNMHSDRDGVGFPVGRQRVCPITSGDAECSALEDIPAGAFKAGKNKGVLAKLVGAFKKAFSREGP